MPYRDPLSSSLTIRMDEATSKDRSAGPKTDTLPNVTQIRQHALPAPHTHKDKTRPYEPQQDYRHSTTQDYKPSTKTSQSKHTTARNHRQRVFHPNYLFPTFFKPTNRRRHVSHNSSNQPTASPTKTTPNDPGLPIDQPGSPSSNRKFKRRNRDKEGHSHEQNVTYFNRPMKTQKNSAKPKIDDVTPIFPPTSSSSICSPTCNRTVITSSTEFSHHDRKMRPVINLNKQQ
jgi:hypothetical protein